MPRMVDSGYTINGVVLDNANDEYSYSTSGYTGSEYDGMYILREYGVFCKPEDTTGTAFSYDFDGKVNLVEVRAKVKKKTTNYENYATIRVFDSNVRWMNPQGLYDAIYGSVETYTTINVTIPNVSDLREVVLVQTADAETCEYIMRYGIAIAYARDLIEISELTVAASITDKYVPAALTLIDENGVVKDGIYQQYPGMPFVISVGYTQEAGAALEQLNVRVQYDGDETYVEKAVYEGATSVTLDSRYMLPLSGTIAVRARPAGTDVFTSELVMPFAVTPCDVRYTSHTSGDTILSDEAVNVVWIASRPEGLDGAPVPGRYQVCVWYDDDGADGGATQQGASVSVAADELSGHSEVYFGVCDVYGTGANLQMRDTPVKLHLYIEEATSVYSVTVSAPDGTDELHGMMRVSWDASGQTAYQLRVGDIYDSGIVWGSASCENVPRLFEAGEYPVSLRIQGANGAWSDWSAPVWAKVLPGVTTVSGEITATLVENGVLVEMALDALGDLSGRTLLLYRDGEMIAQLPASAISIYTDMEAHSVHEYFARCVELSSGKWIETPVVNVDATPSFDCITTDDGECIALKYADAVPTVYAAENTVELTQQYYAGREYPVYMRSGRRTESMTVAYADCGNALAEKIKQLNGIAVYYRNRVGTGMYAVIDGVTVRNRLLNGWTTVTFTMRKAAHDVDVLFRWGAL